MKILFAMIYPPDRGGSGAPIYTMHLLNSLWQNQQTRSGIVFSTHNSYNNKINSKFIKYPLFFPKPPIFDSQPKISYSIPFKDMNEIQIKEYIDTFYDFFCMVGKGKKYAYELIHVQHGMYIGYAAALAKKITQIPYVITLHIMELNFLAEFPDPIFALKAMVDADKIIALTKAQKQRLITEYCPERIIALEAKNKQISIKEAAEKFRQIVGKKINPNKIIVCPLGIDTDKFLPIPKAQVDKQVRKLWPKLPKEGSFVLYAGRLIVMKGILDLLDAELIYNKNGQITTIIAGGGNLEAEVISRIKSRSGIKYLGFVEQEKMPILHNYVAQHFGIFTVPSSSEGLSLVYLEAMNCGMPVIYCCKQDMGDLDIMQTPNATYTPFQQPKHLAKTISIRLNSSKSTKILKNLRKARKYNLNHMYQKVLSVYHKILN